MKTKFYTLLTGLLMAACITSYGQEFVNRFSIQRHNLGFIGCDLVETKTGRF
jgi:hypothetical protein